MFGRRTAKVPVRPVAIPQPHAGGKNCCVRTVPAPQPTQRPVQRPAQRPNPFVKR